MPFGADLPKDMRSRPQRRGPRMNSRIPVLIEWDRRSGAQHRESGFTRVVNPNGCLLVSQVEPELKQHLRVTNVCTRRTADALVVCSFAWCATDRHFLLRSNALTVACAACWREPRTMRLEPYHTLSWAH